MILPELNKNWKIIDIGCGDGWLVKELRDRGYDCIGIEKVYKDFDPKIKDLVICDDFNNNDFKDKEFDCSILMEVIEHLPIESVKEIERITKRKIIISTIIPPSDFLITVVAVQLNLIGGKKMIRETPHLNLYYLKDIPFNDFILAKSKRYFIFDQFGVFERVKKD